jgi:pimeloyl-ACP methyl ester carboxylesterase
MKIDKANLLGWSMGGNEITEFAIRYPERINKLIYFEAGYDLSDEAFSQIVKNLPKQPLPDSADLLSLNTYRKWYHSFWFSDVEWNSSLEDNLRASTIIHQDSSVTTLPDDPNFKNILESIMSYHRDYKNIQVPALAFFTNQFFVPPVKNEEVVSAYANLEKNIITPWRLKNINQLKAEFKNVTIKILPRGSHVSFIYLCKDSLVEAINSFLLNK